MKRANPYSKQGAGKAKKAKMSSKQQNTQLGPFVFENLPGGVRNQIYELVASNEITSLSKTGDRLTSNSGLMLANHQISHEFFTMLEGSPEIYVTIDHWKFTKLMNFLESRTAVGLAHIGAAILKIELKVGTCPGDCDFEDPDLTRWAAFLRRQSSEGTEILAEYYYGGEDEVFGCVLSQCSAVITEHFSTMLMDLPR